MSVNDMSASPYPHMHLSTQMVHESKASAYIIVCVLTALTWDWILSLEEEVKIVKKRKFRVSTIVYCLARIGITGFSLMSTIFHTSPIADCTLYINAMGGMSALGSSANSYLFFLRVRAVYENARSITIVFGVWWLVLLCTNLTFPFSIHTSHATTTQRCYVSAVESWTTVSMWITAGYDTSIFLAISSRIVSYSIPEGTGTTKRRVMLFFQKDSLPRICKDLLQGQLYYFITIGFTILGAVMAVVPVLSVFRTAFTYPAIAVQTIMACKVFRAVVLGYIADVTTPSLVLTTIIETDDSELEIGFEPEV